MRASILDLRYKMKDVLKALERNESVEVSYHGKVKGILMAVREELVNEERKRVQDHPFFGCDRREDLSLSDQKLEISSQINELRKGRYDDL